MTIFYCYITENKRSRRYFIETAEGGTVAWFDELDTTAIVLRYLTGADMTPEGVDTISGTDWKVTYKAVTSSRIDTSALKKALPDLAQQFTKTTTARRFCIA